MDKEEKREGGKKERYPHEDQMRERKIKSVNECMGIGSVSA